MTDKRYGAYGFTLRGVENAHEWLMPAPSEWSDVAVGQEVGKAESGTFVNTDRATISLQGGRALHVVREPPEVLFVGPHGIPTAALVHPYLAPAISVLSHWRGWISFHAGGFQVDGRAWILTARTKGGKSTTLAALAEEDVPILSDDLFVIKDGQGLAGPRSIDLREQSGFKGATDLGKVGMRPRWRLPLGPIAPELPVAGVITLKWSDSEAVRPVPIEERADVLGPSLSIQCDRRGLLTVLSLPTVEIRRPRGPLLDTVRLIEKAVALA